MSPFVISHDGEAGADTVLGVQRVGGTLRVLELLHLVNLTHHAGQQASHQLHHTLQNKWNFQRTSNLEAKSVSDDLRAVNMSTNVSQHAQAFYHSSVGRNGVFGMHRADSFWPRLSSGCFADVNSKIIGESAVSDLPVRARKLSLGLHPDLHASCTPGQDPIQPVWSTHCP